jgi:hypothetical protein
MGLSETQRACLEQAKGAGKSGLQVPLIGGAGWVRTDGRGSRWRDATVWGLVSRGLLRAVDSRRVVLTLEGLQALDEVTA